MNVNLWFAKNEENEIIGVLKSSNENTYTCPICVIKVIPKALESKKITPHFAHVDKEKCSNESMLHFWFKHKFIEHGDIFTIVSDEKHTYKCKDFKTEVTFNLESGVYRPDIVIETECGNEIVFEMANTNKKKVQDYIDRWIELDRIVVEVDINALTNERDIKEFKALYYNGKCFNFNKRDGGYYNAIGKLKEEMRADGNFDVELAKKLDWFWDEICKYENDETINLDEMYLFLETMSTKEFMIIKQALNRRKSNKIINYFMYRMTEKLEQERQLKIKNIEEKYLDVEFINNNLKNNDINYKVISVIRDIGKYIIQYQNDSDGMYYLEFKLIDFDERYILRRVNNLHNRMAYKEIEGILKESIIELNNDYKLSFKLNFDKTGFTIESKILDVGIKEIVYRAKYMYNEIYECKYLFMDKEKFKNHLINESVNNVKRRLCLSCKEIFSITLDEYLYFIKNNLELPKRCESCRKKRKKERLNG